MEAILLRSALLSIKKYGDGGLLDWERQGAKYSQNIPIPIPISNCTAWQLLHGIDCKNGELQANI